ncbi:MAG: helix-turn-helix transcriptional regulator [Ahniella sp.]|nr:helix-turn-helix transcriptional regulator [Ahniella sp.]
MNLGAVIKQEIQRLARREVGNVVKELRGTLKKQRAEIIALKKAVRQAARRPVGRPRAEAVEHSSDDGKQLRFSPKRLAQMRAKKDITLGELARLTETSAPTLTKWLSGASRPSPEQLQKISWIRSQSPKALREFLAKPE